MSALFRVKICGVTNETDAQMVAAAGADAVGLNFYEKSRRFLMPENAESVAAVLPEGVTKVGLFVNATVDRMVELWDRLGLDLIQLHGDEPPNLLKELGNLPVMRAFRLGDEGLAPILAYLSVCRELDCLPRLVLIDSFRKGEYGGTGRTADWGTVKLYPSESWHPPLVLAGGLTAENVAEAIQIVRPGGVDTASGVEGVRGMEAQMVRRFVEAASRAFEETC